MVDCKSMDAPDSEQCLSGAALDCSVPLEDKASNGQKLPNSNGWVTWLEHRTVWLGVFIALNHHHFKHPSFQHFTFNTRASAFTPRHNLIESKPLQVPNPIQSPSDLRESLFVFFALLLLGSLSSFLILVPKCFVSKARDTNCVVILAGSK
jgi:hypothetical protein